MRPRHPQSRMKTATWSRSAPAAPGPPQARTRGQTLPLRNPPRPQAPSLQSPASQAPGPPVSSPWIIPWSVIVSTSCHTSTLPPPVCPLLTTIVPYMNVLRKAWGFPRCRVASRCPGPRGPPPCTPARPPSRARPRSSAWAQSLVVRCQYKKHWKPCWGAPVEEGWANPTKKDTAANIVAKHFPDQPTWPDIWEPTRVSSPTSANSASGPSQSPQTCSVTWGTFTTKRNLTSATCVSDALVNKQIWTDTCGNTRTMDRQSLMVWDQEDTNFSCLQNRNKTIAARH